MTRRAIGIIRVSRVAGREGDTFHSPAIQADHIRRDCQRFGLTLVSEFAELDVSGGKPIAERRGLREAIRMVEVGEAEAIVFAYRDRMDRSIEHGSELIRRMDAAGATLIADGKQITHATHDGWRHATLESFLNEDQRRAVGAKMYDVHRTSVEKGVPPFMLPLGYRRRKDGRAEPDPKTRQIIWQAWVMRAGGASVPECRAYLLSQRIKVQLSTVSRMFRKRFYLGELRYRDFVNEHAHEPLVTPQLWEDVQKVTGTLGGRRSQSERLLARQGLVVCASCRRRLSVSTKAQHRSPFYRCTNADCSERPTITARLLEPFVVKRVRELTDGLVGRASAASGVAAAKTTLDSAQGHLDRATRVLLASELEDEATASDMLRDLRAARDDAQAAYDKVLAVDEAMQAAVTAGDVLDDGTLDEKRALIKAVIELVTVAPGKGTGRVVINARVA